MVKKAVWVLGGVVLLAGCGQTSAGSPHPSTDGPVSSSERDYGAPELTSPPLDAPTKAPCELLSPEQWKQGGYVTEPELHKGEPAWNCIRGTSERSERRLNVAVLDSPSGIRGIYSRRDSSYGHFEESSIEGYPAVTLQTTEGSAICYTVVLVQKDKYVDIHSTVNEPLAPNNTCAVSQKMAKLSIQHLKEQG